MKILKIKLEIFNHNFHKYFSKINMLTNPYYMSTTRRLECVGSNLLANWWHDSPEGLAARLGLGWSGPRA